MCLFLESLAVTLQKELISLITRKFATVCLQTKKCLENTPGTLGRAQSAKTWASG